MIIDIKQLVILHKFLWCTYKKNNFIQSLYYFYKSLYLFVSISESVSILVADTYFSGYISKEVIL